MESQKLLSLIKQLIGEIDERSEMDFRYSFARYILETWLEWGRHAGEGHFIIEEERKDILLFDDSNPGLIVAVIETKKPAHELDLEDVSQLNNYMKEIGSAKYAILTNGKRIIFYSFFDKNIKKLNELNLLEISMSEELTPEVKRDLLKLEELKCNNFTKIGDIDFFRSRYGQIDLKYEKGTGEFQYQLFIKSLKESLNELTSCFETLFEEYITRDEKSGRFLKSAFNEWIRWRTFSGVEGDPDHYFCRETAYILMNRSLFARICEDKNLLPRNYLSYKGMITVLEEGIRNPYIVAFERVERVLKESYERIYSLNIFDWWHIDEAECSRISKDELERQKLLEDELDNALKNTLRRLNVFSFKYLNRDLLGHIYEDYLPKEERKALGEFYTPIEVVDYILDHVNYKPDRNIGNLKVIDPACGSGTFLVRIADRLVRHYLRKLRKIFINELTPDEAKIILESIINNIYGMDINPFAAHISEMDLLFNTIDLYALIRSKYPHHTINRFNIICNDTLLENSERGPQTSLVDFLENGRAARYLKEQDEANKIKLERFNLVIGNPPYVRIQNIDNRDVYSKIYTKVAEDNYDIYYLFIQRGLKWLKDDGMLGFINPNRFINADSAGGLRELMLNYSIKQILDFKDVKVFDASTAYPSIIIIENSMPENNMIRCSRTAKGVNGKVDEEMLRGISEHINEEYTNDDPNRWYDTFEYPQALLGRDIWCLMPNRERGVFDKINAAANKTLKDICSEQGVFVGLQTSADRVYIGRVQPLDEKQVLFTPMAAFSSNYETKYKLRQKDFPIEKSILRRILKGADITKWGVNWDESFVIFPYHISKKGAELIKEDEMKEEYSSLWEYLSYFRNILEGRENGKLKGRSEWYRYIYPKNLEKFHNIKIILSVLAETGKFYLDEVGDFCFVGGGTAGAYGLRFTEEYDRVEIYKYVTAILNSKVIEFVIEHVAFIFEGGYFTYRGGFLEILPIGFSCVEDVANYAQEIQGIIKNIKELEKKVEFIRNYVNNAPLSVSMIEIALEIVIKKEYYNLNKIIFKLNENSEYIISLNKNDYMKFDDKDIAKFIYYYLRRTKSITKSDILALRLPSKEKMMCAISELEEDKDKLDKLIEVNNKLQKDLENIITTKIYGLNENDIEVIDRFLKIWSPNQ